MGLIRSNLRTVTRELVIERRLAQGRKPKAAVHVFPVISNRGRASQPDALVGEGSDR
jgi:hypothetical protein